MGTWDISKDFHLEYGHRVHNQQLKKDLCAVGDHQCACRHLHGHSGKVTIHLSGDTLERGMVTDFKHLGFMKDFIDNHLDHKFIIDKNDPGFESIVSFDYHYLLDEGMLTNVDMDLYRVAQVIDTDRFMCMSPEDVELLQSFVIVDFLPTSENLAKYIYEVAHVKLKGMVSGVDWQETAKSIARFRK